MREADAALIELLAAFDPAELDLAADAEECTRDLATFVRGAWPSLDTAPYQHSWHIDAMMGGSVVGHYLGEDG